MSSREVRIVCPRP